MIFQVGKYYKFQGIGYEMIFEVLETPCNSVGFNAFVLRDTDTRTCWEGREQWMGKKIFRNSILLDKEELLLEMLE